LWSLISLLHLEKLNHWFAVVLHHQISLGLLNWPTNCGKWLCFDRRGSFKHSGRRIYLQQLWKRTLISVWAKAKWHMKLFPRAWILTTADEEEHCTCTVPQNLGHYWGLGSECYMVWWLHSFYKLQQWSAFSMTVVARLGQWPFSPSLVSHSWNWPSVILSFKKKITIVYNYNCTVHEVHLF